MHDANNPKQADPTLCTDLLNVVPDADVGDGLVGRPGFVLLNTTAMASGADGQGVIQFTSKTGTNYTFLVSGGKIYRQTWTSGTAATLTDVTPVGVTIDASATHVYSVNFADTIIISDGVNRPWKMTSLLATPITGAYLTDVPGAFYGPPVVYYAKLFGIKAAERDTIIWSEENDPDTGYEAGVNDNVWTLAQTDVQPLTCLCPTNEALFYFRSRSIGRILGAVESDFVTSGVHDSISTTEGTVSPAAVVLIDRDIYFLNDRGDPHVIRQGGAVEDLSEGIRETLADASTSDIARLPSAFATYSHDLGMLLIAHPGVGAGNLRTMLALHLPTGNWFGQWRLAGGATEICKAGPVVDFDGLQRVLLLDTAGFAYVLSFRRAATGNDALNVGGSSVETAVEHSITGPWMGYSDTVNQLFTRLDFTARYLSTTPFYGVSWQTTSANSAGSETVFLPTGVTADRDIHAALGINAHGRAIRFTMSHSGTSSLFSLSHLRVTGAALSDSPGQA